MSQQIPQGWVATTIEEIGELVTGSTPATKNKEFYGGDIPFVKPGDLDAFDPISRTDEMVTSQGAAQGRLLPPDTILVSCIGNLGKVGILKEQGISNQQINAIIPSPHVSSRFVYHWARTLRTWLNENSSATTIRIINKGRFAKAPFLLPPKDEQLRIGEKLDTLLTQSRRAKEGLDAIPALLERFQQSVLAAAFRGDLTADWRAKHPNVEPASKLLECIRAERRRRWEEAELNSMQVKGKLPKDNSWKKKYEEPEPPVSSALPSLPDGWGWASIDELILGDRKLAYGVLKPGNHDANGVRLLKSGQIRNGTIDLTEDFRITKELDAEFSRTRLKGGEVLLNLVGASIGRSAVAPSELSGANVSRAIAVIPIVQGFAEWVQLTLDGPAGQMFMQERKGGSAQPVLNLSEVRTLCIAIPPMAELRAIEQRIQQTFTKLTAITEAHALAQERISTIDESILAKAFRGELVPQDPNDEPASVLLERIRAEREASDGSTPKRSRGRRPAA